jgi:uncharacterized protein
LLFTDAPKPLIDKIEQVVRLIRSKGVGVYFVTQNPLDVPDTVLGQLGNRVQHALRAFTPRDQKAVKAAATTFRANPKVDVEKTIMEMGVGEALVSVLDEKGIPGMVERAFIYPPLSQIGPITPQQRQQIITSSVVYGTYEKTVDRESAYERLKGRAESAPQQAPPQQQYQQPQYQQTQAPQQQSSGGGFMGQLGTLFGGTTGPRGGHREGLGEAMAKSAVRAVGSSVGRQLIRGVLGGLMGSSRNR